MAKKKANVLEPIGKKIKKERLKKKMTLDLVANETGLSIDELKKIETGKKIPPVGTLLQIARALEIDSGFFLKEQETSLRSRIKAYTKRTENYAYTTLTPGAENKHLKAFKVVYKKALRENKEESATPAAIGTEGGERCDERLPF